MATPQTTLAEHLSHLTLELEPQEITHQQAQRATHLNTVVIPALRVLGMGLVALGVVLHNVFLLGSFAWASFLPLTGLLLGYAFLSWPLLALFYRSGARVDLGVVFLTADVFLWTAAIYCAGAEQGYLFFILLMRAADQAHTSFRRALAFAHLPVLTYALMLLYVSLADQRAVAWPAALVQLTFIYGGSLYIALTARTAERRRRQTTTAIRLARGLVRRLQERAAQLQHSQTTLARLRAQHELILHSAGEGICGLDRQGRVTFMNAAATHMTGWETAELTGQALHAYLHHAALDGTPYPWEGCPVHTTLEAGTTQHVEGEVFWRKDGGSFPVAYTSAPIREQGEVVGAVVIFRDVTERQRTEEAMRRSEEYFRALTDHALDIITVLNRDGTVRYVSPAAERVLGYTSEDSVGTEGFGFVHPDDVSEAMTAFAEAVTKPGVTLYRGDYRLRHRDGSWRVVECVGKNLLTNPAVQGIVVNCRDITARRQAEDALRESEARYRELFENANDAIVTFTLEGIVTSVNRGLEAMLGWSREELIGQHYRKFVTPASAALGEERTRRFLAGERPPSIFEGEQIRKDGRVVPVEVRTRPIRDREGKPVGIQGIYRDLTARKQAEEALHRSAAHFRALVEHALDFVVVLNRDGTVRYESPAVARMLGFTPQEREGRSGFEHLHPADVPQVRQTFAQIITIPGATVFLEFRARHKDGSWRTLEAVGTNLLDDPVVAGVVVNYRDITERKRMEEALHQAYAELERHVQDRTAELSQANAALRQEIAHRQRLEAALQEERNLLEVTLTSIGDGVITTDATAALTFMNAVAEQLTGWSSQEAVGREIGEVFPLLHEHTGQPVEDPVGKVLREKVVVGLANHTVLAARDGRMVPIADNGAPIRDQDGRVHGAVVVFRDVTESRQAEAALRQAKEAAEAAQEAAEAANRAKSEFLATMSHELRTPLHVILGYINLLLDGGVGELSVAQVETVRRIERNAQVLFELINMVLDLNRLEAGRLPVEVAAVGVAQLLADIKGEMQGLWDQSELAVEWLVAPGLPALHTDPDKLKVVLKNLLSNAVKFTKAGSISIAAREHCGGIEISVSDTGIGIPPEALTLIFEPFRQVDSSATRRYRGSGLGLHIVQRLLELLGGTIAVESEVGRGSTFRVWMPPTGEQ
jgi:PAS domain S-box-containing protein